LPDHFALLANIVRWTAGDRLPLHVEGTGLIDCHMYEQPGRVILHMVNLTSEATWRAPLDELIKIGPFKVAIRLPERVSGRTARLLVSATDRPVVMEDGMAVVAIDAILDHEVVVIG
jgi:hypothetical protein